jgi:hypothetical protein
VITIERPNMDELNALRLEAEESRMLLEKSRIDLRNRIILNNVPSHFEGTMLDYLKSLNATTGRHYRHLNGLEERIEVLEWDLMGPRFVGHVKSWIWDPHVKDARKSTFLSIHS